MRRTEGRFFYEMPETGASQWIYTHPVEGAPRTGEGIFPSEVVEVVQVGDLPARPGTTTGVAGAGAGVAVGCGRLR